MKTRKTDIIHISCLLILIVCSKDIHAQNVPPVNHKIGAYYTELMDNGMQKTHEYQSTIYINALDAGKTITLTLPSRTTASPHHYYRWYDYNTDNITHSITTDQTFYEQPNGFTRYGGSLLEYMHFTIDANNMNQTIACDVSSYTDYTTSGNYITEEPTLSYRAIYDIRDANEIATLLKEKTDAGEYAYEVTVYMPAVPASIHQSPRVTMQYDDNSYFGYDGNATPNLYKGSLSVKGDKYKSKSGRFIYVNPGPANTSTEIIVELTVGSAANQRVYNVAKYTIHFIDESPEEFPTTGYRSIDHLDENYVLINKLDFDYDTAPATATNNMWSYPLDWDICDYGFSSEALFNAGYRGFTDNKVAKWNEYGFYKTANVSIPGLNAYTWYNNNKKVYDCRYFTSNGAEQGYFMYIDAAQTPGVIAKLPIEQLCGGTKLIVSAGVASLTQSGATSYPNINLVFIGIDENGHQTELNRYSSGDIPSYTGNDVTPWYQLYYTFTFNSDIEYVSYAIQLENNSTSTSGGDYAIDDIRIYRSKPAVQAYQLNFNCGEEEAKIKMRVQYDKLLSSLGENEITGGNGASVPLKFKILDSDLNPIEYQYGSDYEFGQINISTRFTDMTPLISGYPPVADNDLTKTAYTETETIDGIEERYVVFLIPTSEGLRANLEYYMVIADKSNNFDTGICALISDPFSLTPLYSFTMNGSPWIEGDGLCYGNPVTVGVTLRSVNDPDIEVETIFDWYLGELEEFQEIASGANYSTEKALNIYRSVYPIPSEGDSLSPTTSGNYTTEVYNFLANKIEEGKLVLNQKELTKVLREGNTILAIPLLETATLPVGIDIADLCDNTIIIIASGPAQNPTMELGNEYVSSLRMGVLQFRDMANNLSKTASIPVWDFMNADQTKDRNLSVTQDTKVYVIETNDSRFVIDPYEPDTFVEIAEITAVNVSGSSNDNVTFSIPSNITLTPQEGYTYMVEFHFRQIPKPNEGEVCDGTARLTIKIVPEYLTWTGAEGDNWNNDNNWRRSVQSELYKTDYTDDPDSYGFVPMDFSKVTILSINEGENDNYPWLYGLTGSPYLNLDNSNYTTATDKAANAATDQIEYELILKTDGSNYAAGNFYGNTADQVYFKYGAEMRNTNYLTYNKAHIDLELTPGRWYMLASPLQGTFAGDMYLPSATGRQETEAFTAITYNTTDHDRFSPAVYQRSWDQANSIVFYSDGVTREDAYISSQWSMVYNQVDEEYIPGRGFSIRTIMNDNIPQSVLYRLPKEDSNYIYYSYDGAVTGNNTVLDRSRNGRLAFESPMTDVTVSIQNETGNNAIFLVGNPFMATLDMEKFFDANTDLERKYWINTGSGLSGIQFNTGGTVTPSGDKVLTTTIAPMQAFFVERTDGGNLSSITFTPEMTVVSTSSPIYAKTRSIDDEQPPVPELRIRASRLGMESSIRIRQDIYATNGFDADEDMRVIIDSNHPETPILYTMADNIATIINTVSDLTNIPLGVYSEDESEVTVTVEGIDEWENELFLYDALLDQSIPLTGPYTTITLPGNTHNRFYLQTSTGTISENQETAIYMYSNEKGMISIETADPDGLKEVKIYGTDGMILKEIIPVGENPVTVSLPSERIYVVTAFTKEKTLRRKVYCR